MGLKDWGIFLDGKINWNEYVRILRRKMKKGYDLESKTIHLVNCKLDEEGIINSERGWVIASEGKILDLVNFYKEKITKFTEKEYAEGLVRALNPRGKYKIIEIW